MRRGVVVTGPPRSGTSLVAGLFAAHGVFFGRCKPADENNPRGYFEHPAIPRQRGKAPDWPLTWWRTLKREGWDGASPWGAKHMATRWRWLLGLLPAVVVVTVRPEATIRESLKRTGWHIAPDTVVRHFRKRFRRLQREATCPVVLVSTPALVAGDYTEIRRAFEVLGVPFDPAIAEAWIDPSVWGRKAVAT